MTISPHQHCTLALVDVDCHNFVQVQFLQYHQRPRPSQTIRQARPPPIPLRTAWASPSGLRPQASPQERDEPKSVLSMRTVTRPHGCLLYTRSTGLVGAVGCLRPSGMERSNWGRIIGFIWFDGPASTMLWTIGSFTPPARVTIT